MNDNIIQKLKNEGVIKIPNCFSSEDLKFTKKVVALLSVCGTRLSLSKTSTNTNLPSKNTILSSTLPSKPILQLLLTPSHLVPVNSSLPSTLYFVLHRLHPLTHSLPRRSLITSKTRLIQSVMKSPLYRYLPQLRPHVNRYN